MRLFQSGGGEVEAAAVNIVVEDNNQVISVDQASSTTTITKISRVTVKDSGADYGYILSAKIAQNTLPNATVRIGSSSDVTNCRIDDPCLLTTTNQEILRTKVNEHVGEGATSANGETTEWAVTITIPANADLDNYLIDIEYSEVAYVPDTTYGPIQALTNTNCSTTRGTAYDARNGQIYYVQKIANSGGAGVDLCWMESNLRYSGDGIYKTGWSWGDDRYSKNATNDTATTNDNTRPLVKVSGTDPSLYTEAQYADPLESGIGSTDYQNTNPESGFFGYLYNWCTAMGGQSGACDGTTISGFDVGVSICPAGWRLPTGNGGELYALNNAVNGGLINTDVGLRTNFLVVYSGGYVDGLYDQIGNHGVIWSSTVRDGGSAHNMNYFSNAAFVYNHSAKQSGIIVRCVR